jgi:hypothetical protein
MFEDEDLDKANWLHEHGMCVYLNMTELAKRLYEQRKSQSDTSKDVKPLVPSDRV